MLVLANVLLGFSIISTFVLGVLIYVSGPRKRINLYLSATFASIVIWMVANLLTNLSESQATSLLFARSTLVGASFIPYFFLLFAVEFAESRRRIFSKRYLLVLPIFLLLFTPTSYNIMSVESYGANTEPGAIYSLLILVYILYFGLFTRLMWGVYRAKDKSPQKRNQAKLVLLGLLLTVIPTLLTNAVLPIFGLDSALYYGPSSVLLLVYLTSIAIIRHHLFNIRLVVSRTMAYLGALLVLFSLYLLGAFRLSSYVQGLTSIDFLDEIVTFGTTILVAILYVPTKKFFDRVTNKVFYRDAYSPQSLIDQLNNSMVSNIDLEILLSKSAQIIQNEIKSSFCVFYIHPTSYLPARTIGADRQSNDFIAIDSISRVATRSRTKVVVTDGYGDALFNEELVSFLRQDNIGAMVRLVDTVDYEVQGVGYMFLGQKKSGSPYTKQDVKILGTIANGLVVATENILRYEEIDQFNVTLQKKIDTATNELKRNNQKLKALDEAKDEFISMASHQLRTPLTSIKGYVSMVAEGDIGKVSGEQKKMLDQALFSSQRMVHLIADLLNVSRLRTGKFVVETRPTSLPDVIESELNQIRAGAEAKDITMLYNKPKDFPTLELDEVKIRQVIMNFVDNAIYYTPKSGNITLELQDKKKSVEFTVKDTGIGVPKRDQPKLFTKFYRAENARKARPDGTGLGLFMAKKVVIAQGGSVIFESKEDKGSTFGFSFPKGQTLSKSTDRDTDA